MELVRTVDKVNGNEITIRTTTLSVDTNTIEDLKVFFEGRKIQLAKLKSQAEELKARMAKLDPVGDEKELKTFEKKNMPILKRLASMGIRDNLKYQLQGCEIESEKLEKDIIQLQALFTQIEQKKE